MGIVGDVVSCLYEIAIPKLISGLIQKKSISWSSSIGIHVDADVKEDVEEGEHAPS